MPSRPTRTRASWPAALTGLLLLSAAACSPGSDPQNPTVATSGPSLAPSVSTPAPSVATSGATAPSPSGPAYSTGTLSGPVLAVKIDNTSGARPRVGLTAADVVYVELVEGGLTRLLAIYASQLPAHVGPVRSARETDAVLLANYGPVAFGYSGASAYTLGIIRQGTARHVSYDLSGAGYQRVAGRSAPYNLLASPSALLARAGGSTYAGDVGFRFGPAPVGGAPAAGVRTAYPAARIELRWDATARRYLVSTDGRPEVSDGVQVGAASVVVQTVRSTPSNNVDVNGQPTPVLQVVGSGPVRVLRDGLVFSGTWTRPSPTAPTAFVDGSGAALPLPQGPVWVLLVPSGQEVSVG